MQAGDRALKCHRDAPALFKSQEDGLEIIKLWRVLRGRHTKPVRAAGTARAYAAKVLLPAFLSAAHRFFAAAAIFARASALIVRFSDLRR
jgi:hypothetical protein